MISKIYSMPTSPQTSAVNKKKGVGTLTHYATLALDSLPCVISKAHAKMILRSHLGITNHLTRAFLLIIYMVRIVQIQVADNFAKRPVAANSEESL